jgi:hypothetical protein
MTKVDKLISVLNEGKSISNHLYQFITFLPNSGMYFLCCENPGCCNTDFNENELRDFLDDDDIDKWIVND